MGTQKSNCMNIHSKKANISILWVEIEELKMRGLPQENIFFSPLKHTLYKTVYLDKYLSYMYLSMKTYLVGTQWHHLSKYHKTVFKEKKQNSMNYRVSHLLALVSIKNCNTVHINKVDSRYLKLAYLE